MKKIVILILLYSLCVFADDFFILPSCNIRGNTKTKGDVDISNSGSLLKSFKNTYTNTLIIDLGNFASPAYESFRSEGEEMVDIFNNCRYDILNLGYHELDFGIEKLEKNIISSKFECLSSNIKGINGVKPYIVKNIAGYRILFLGLCSQNIKLRLKKNTLDKLHILDYKSAIDIAIKSAPKHDKVILLDNLTFNENLIVSKQIDKLDIIIFPSTNLIKSMEIGNTRLIGINSGIDIRKVICINDHSVDSTEFIASNFPKDPSIILIFDKYKKKDKNQNIVITEVKEKDNFPMIVTNILRRLTKSEVSFINSGFFRSGLKENKLTLSRFNRMFLFKDRFGSLKISGKMLKKIFDRSEGQSKRLKNLVWAGAEKRNGQLYINDLLIDDKEIYNVATIDFVKNGGDGYISLCNIPYHKESNKYFQDALLDYFQSHQKISLNDFRFNRFTKRKQRSSFDISFSEVHYNNNRDLYNDKSISMLQGSDKSYFKGRYKSKIDYFMKNRVVTLNIDTDVQRQNQVEENNKFLIMLRDKRNGQGFQQELKLDTSWNKLHNERYPLTASYGILNRLKWKRCIESKIGYSIRKNFANQDKSSGLQLYLKNEIPIFNARLSNYLDMFHGFTGEDISTLELENRMSIKLKRDISWFFNYTNYFYRDEDIQKWGRKYNAYSGISFKWSSKSI